MDIMKDKKTSKKIDISKDKMTTIKMAAMKGDWIKLSKFNTFVKDTSILPIKSPHNNNQIYSSSLFNYDTFYLQELVENLEKQNRPLKCILDLSEATHYTKKDIEALSGGVEYKKVKIKGKSIPNENDLKEILKIISKYDSNNESICIHCKHGLNRTGYIIVSYLILIKGIENKLALQIFEEARGLKIENKQYVNELLKLKKVEGKI